MSINMIDTSIVQLVILAITIGSIVYASGKQSSATRAEAKLAVVQATADLQRQIDSMALYVRDNYIHKDPMTDMMNKHIRSTEQQITRIEEGFIRLEAKVDNAIIDRVSQKVQHAN